MCSWMRSLLLGCKQRFGIFIIVYICSIERGCCYGLLQFLKTTSSSVNGVMSLLVVAAIEAQYVIEHQKFKGELHEHNSRFF